MKAWTLLLVVLAVSSCKYDSKIEADNACYAWEAKGFSYTSVNIRNNYKGDKKNPPDHQTFTSTSDSRQCVHEPETRQYLGYETKGIRKGKVIKHWSPGVFAKIEKNSNIN